MKKLSGSGPLCYNLADHMWKNDWGCDVSWMKCLPFGLFCHIMACGVMHLSYLALLSSHIVGASNGQIQIAMIFDYHIP